MNLQELKNAVVEANNNVGTPESLKRLMLTLALDRQFKGTPISFNKDDMETGMYKINKVDNFETEIIIPAIKIKHNGFFTNIKVTKYFTQDIIEYLIEFDF